MCDDVDVPQSYRTITYACAQHIVHVTMVLVAALMHPYVCQVVD
jgi:hypothetical protein